MPLFVVLVVADEDAHVGRRDASAETNVQLAVGEYRGGQPYPETMSNRLALCFIYGHRPCEFYRILAPAENEWQLSVASGVAGDAWYQFGKDR